MSSTEQQTNGRLRRPVPQRTTPRRNILGVFSQRADDRPRPRTSAQMDATDAHPLGIPIETGSDQADRIAPDLNQQDMQAASKLIDRHIRDGEKYTISTDQDTWTRLSSLAGKIDANEIAEIAKVVTQSYTEIASIWVELAGKLRDALNSQAGANGSSAAPSAAHGLTICIQSARKVSARIRMFESGAVCRVQPLLSETSASTAMITDVTLEDGQINIQVPPKASSGDYHGILLSNENKPVGAVTLTIPETKADEA